MSFEERRIVVAVDGSEESDAAVLWAADESVLRRTPITLCHVISPLIATWPVTPEAYAGPEWYEENASDVLAKAHKIADAQIHHAGLDLSVDERVLHGNVVEAITEFTRNAELVVAGCRGLGAFGRVMLGSTSRGLVRHAHCPAVVVHHHANRSPSSTAGQPVLLGIDGSPVSEAATAFAFDEAARRHVAVVALHVWTDVGLFPAFMDWDQVRADAHEVLAERLAGWQERYPDVHIERQVECDRPARRLIEGAEHAQLVVVGARGRGGFAGMHLGSVATAVAAHAAAPVVVVREQQAPPKEQVVGKDSSGEK